MAATEQNQEEPSSETAGPTWLSLISNSQLASSISGLIPNGNDNSQREDHGPTTADGPASHDTWYTILRSKLHSLPLLANNQEEISFDTVIEYSQLTAKQIQFLEIEAQQEILKRTSSWCWFADVTYRDGDGDGDGYQNHSQGELSVANTGSCKCPLKLKKYPVALNPSHQIYINNSVILPGSSVTEYFHAQSTASKLAMAVKKHYNFPNERHLYLKKNTSDLLRDKKVVIVSIVGYLPEKYERSTLGETCSAKYLSDKITLNLRNEFPGETLAFSLECPLDQKNLASCFDECVTLLCNWRTKFHDVDAIFLTGVYHSVPLALLLTRYILENRNLFQVKPDAYVGVLAIESCLKGYTFWDHSMDNNNKEDNAANFQASREKALYQGCSKVQQEVLSKIRNYRNLSSEESKLIQKTLDWLVYHWGTFRMTLTGRLHDNFMTMSQKLAVDYQHPKIVRNLWCDATDINVDLKNVGSTDLPNVSIKTLKFEATYNVPRHRFFEVALVNNLLLAINLGRTEFVSMFKLINPFFISRSFNEHTTPSNLRKQQQSVLKSWLQEMDIKWKDVGLPDHAAVPQAVNNLHDLLEFLQYKSQKLPDIIKIKDKIFDDDSIYQVFVENTIQTRSPLKRDHLSVLRDSSTPKSILNSVNQYDLVWKFHECLSKFARLRNLPCRSPLVIDFSISSGRCISKTNKQLAASFRRNNNEALRRLQELWSTYQSWNPPTTGLKQLQRILSVLSLYESSLDLNRDIHRT